MAKAWQRLAFGELSQENLDNVRRIRGYFWDDADGDLPENEIKRRTRQYSHIRMQFPASDPYSNLYSLAESDNHSDFWLALEECQQNRTRVN